jgi:hypothetical protein
MDMPPRLTTRAANLFQTKTGSCNRTVNSRGQCAGAAIVLFREWPQSRINHVAGAEVAA